MSPLLVIQRGLPLLLHVLRISKYLSILLPIIYGFPFVTWFNTSTFQGLAGSPIEVETMVRDTTEHPPTDVILSPQQQTEFQSGSLVAPQSPASPPTLDPSNVANESASTTILTPSKIRTIKQRNPVKALRKLQQILHFSTDAPPPSSTVVTPSKLHVEVVFILQQLKAPLFNGEFLRALKREGEIARDIFKFLDSLALYDLPASMVKYFIEFEAFFTEFVKDLNLRQNADLQIKTKLNKAKIEWDSSEACERELDEFEHKKEERLRQREAFD